jgi:hypothetical protein
MADTEPDPSDDVRRLESDLGLRDQFFEDLLKEDDWSFIIKLHALVDAAIAHLLAETAGRPELLDVFSRLPLGGRNGKLAFAEALDCLDEQDRLFIQVLSEIRNKFAHDVRDAGASLTEHVDRMAAPQFQRLKKAIGPGHDPFVLNGRSVPEAIFVRGNVKLCFWLMAMFTLALSYSRKTLATSRRELQDAMLEAARLRSLLRGA